MESKRADMLLVALAAVAVLAAVPAAAAPTDWLTHGVVYQIYPRSFLDGCAPACTGTGSVRGIRQKLAYLRDDLGVDVGEYTHVIANLCHDRSATNC